MDEIHNSHDTHGRTSPSRKGRSVRRSSALRIDIDFAKVSISECNPSVAPSATVPTESSALIEANDILAFLNDDDLHTETERAKQQFANLLDDTEHNTSSVDLFTIDDDDDFLNLSS